MRELLSKRFASLLCGLSLFVALITLAIAAILLTWAVPTLQDFITRNRMSTEVNNFVAAIYVARSESVKRLQYISLCPSATPPNCVSGSNYWHQGWILFSNVNGTNVVIQQNTALPRDRFRITSNRNGGAGGPGGRAGADD